MPKIAFVDVDMTLVNNRTSAYNEALIAYLADPINGFDQVYLVTGRNVSDLWQHVLQQGRPSDGWQKQLLPNVRGMLRQRGVNVVGVSTPYDHYLAQTGGNTRYGVRQAGDAAEKFYMEFEASISALARPNIDSLSTIFSDRTGGNIYVDMPDGAPDQPLSLALPTYLAMKGDTEKRGQFEFLLQRVNQEHREEECDLVFFDDKPENLHTFNTLCADKGFRSYSTFLVEDVVTAPASSRGAYDEGSPALAQDDIPDAGEQLLPQFNALVVQLATKTREQRNLNNISPAQEDALLGLIQRLNDAQVAFESSNGRGATNFKTSCNQAIADVKPILSKHSIPIFGPIFAAISHFFSTLLKVLRGEPRDGIAFFDSRTTAAKELGRFEDNFNDIVIPMVP